MDNQTRLEALTNDPMMGIFRNPDAGYDIAPTRCAEMHQVNALLSPRSGEVCGETS
jgi:urocanate hydratase